MIIRTPDTYSIINNEFCSKDDLSNRVKVFLAGPISGNIEWRKELIEKIDKLYDDNYTIFYNPQRNDMTQATFKSAYTNHHDQYIWEIGAIGDSDIIVFNIPAPIVKVDDYARTTRFELAEQFGKMLATNNKDKKIIILKMYDDFPGAEYIKFRIDHTIIGNKYFAVANTDEELIYYIDKAVDNVSKNIITTENFIK